MATRQYPHSLQPILPPRPRLDEWHSISVMRYEMGTVQAFHNRLDMQTRKLVTERLADPMERAVGLPWYVVSFLRAAEELEVDIRLERGTY